MVSKVAENNSAEPPPPLDPPRAGCHDTAVPDPHGAAVPWQGSDLFVSHFLKHNTAQELSCVPWDSEGPYCQTSKSTRRVGTITSFSTAS